MFTNQNKITEMLESLDKEIIKRPFIETFFGKQDPSKGYQLRSITILEKGALAEVYPIHNTMMQESHTYV